MKVYHPEGSSTTLMVAPGHFHPEVSDWNRDGSPIRFDVVFVSGAADVDKKLGEWLIEKGHAHRTGLRRATRKLITALA